MDVALAVAGFAEVIVLVVVIAGAVGGKNEPDPQGERPLAIYLAAAAVVATFVAFAGVGLTATAVKDLATENSHFSARGVDEEGFSFEEKSSSGNDSERNREITELVTGLIVLCVGAAVLVFHEPRIARLARNSDGPGLRVVEKTAYILCFSALVAVVVAAAVTVFAVYRSIAPGIAGDGDRDEALRGLIVPVVLLVTATGIFSRNWARAPHRLLSVVPAAER